jgi:hypothetical protein
MTPALIYMFLSINEFGWNAESLVYTGLVGSWSGVLVFPHVTLQKIHGTMTALVITFSLFFITLNVHKHRELTIMWSLLIFHLIFLAMLITIRIKIEFGEDVGHAFFLNEVGILLTINMVYPFSLN